MGQTITSWEQSYWVWLESLLTVCLFVCFIRALRHFQQSFSHIARVSGCGRELNAHIWRAALLKYHPTDTWHNIPPSHIILTLNWPVLIPSSTFLMLSAKQKNSTIFKLSGMAQPGIKPATFWSQSGRSTNWATVPVLLTVCTILYQYRIP